MEFSRRYECSCTKKEKKRKADKKSASCSAEFSKKNGNCSALQVLVDPQYSVAGVGYYDTEGVTYWTALFG